jgi:hypothetical protein
MRRLEGTPMLLDRVIGEVLYRERISRVEHRSVSAVRCCVTELKVGMLWVGRREPVDIEPSGQGNRSAARKHQRQDPGSTVGVSPGRGCLTQGQNVLTVKVQGTM